MSYQVLARKYRPKSFQTLVGQEHVVRALTHALEQQRLHHAYLFTGTRGVGKTTLSRILAKSLNCETGITATPCGVCEACVAIDAGRFVDYIEMDAASNRGVDEMAQLLEQAVYAPSNARFKVYMIDEVHMLTNHAFNSMLKTLEEPPPHVKFILATTDPQKIPVTVLSRCLQFNLKQMPMTSIIGHLENILGQEQINFELPALRLLAQGAQGSMRDALSLTDQAIAYAAGTVSLEAVQGMLGALDQTYLIQICDALAAQDGAALLAVADQMATRSLSYKAALQDLATLLHQLTIAQLVPAAIADDLPERAEILRLAGLFDAEQIQLFYQIAVHGRNELGLAPDEYAGFSMTLLRMLAFRPVTGESTGLLNAPATNSGPSARSATPAARPSAAAAMAAVSKPTTPVRSAPAAIAEAPPVKAAVPVPPVQVNVAAEWSADGTTSANANVNSAPNSASPTKLSPAMAALQALNCKRGMPRNTETTPAPTASVAAPISSAPAPSSASTPPWEELDLATDQEFSAEKKTELIPQALPEDAFPPASTESSSSQSTQENKAATSPTASAPAKPALVVIPPPDVTGALLSNGQQWDGDWPSLSASLPLRGVAQQLAQQSELVSCEVTPNVITMGMRVPLETLLASGSADKLAAALTDLFSVPVKVTTDIGNVQRTAHAAAIVERAARLDAAEIAIKDDLLVQGLMRQFGATIVPGSIKPLH